MLGPILFFAAAGLLQSVLLVGLAAAAAHRADPARTLNRWRLRPGQLRDERAGLLLTVASDGLVLGLVTSAGLLPATRFVPADAAITFVALFAWFELAFYAVHRAMHARWLFRFHVRHHRSTVPTAWSSMSFHPVERLGIQVGYLAFPLLFAHAIPFSRQGMALLPQTECWYDRATGEVHGAKGTGFGARPVRA